MYKTETKCTRIPTRLSDCLTPLLDINIEGHSYAVEVDLGSKIYLTLRPEIFTELHKKPEKMLKWRDIKGDPHETALYLIKKVCVEDLEWSNLEAAEMSLEAESASMLKEDPNPSPPDSQKVGRVGLPFLRKANICLDLSDNAFFFCNSLKELQKKNIFPKKFKPIPFHFIRNTIVIQAETIVGTLNLAVDTGCTVSLIKTPLLEGKGLKKDWRGLDYFITPHCILGGNDFGRLDLYPFPIAPQIREVDGALGMDFLKKHVIYIDYRKQLILVGDKAPEIPNGDIVPFAKNKFINLTRRQHKFLCLERATIAKWARRFLLKDCQPIFCVCTTNMANDDTLSLNVPNNLESCGT